MDIKIDADLLGNSDAWLTEWHDKRNAAVSELVRDGIAKRPWTNKDDLSREEQDDEQMRWFFWQHHKPDSDRRASERMTSPDASLYEGVTRCMRAARNDERRRIAKAISSGLKVLLGDEFSGVMYDIAFENDINIGSD
jgi:hypothetical protein